MEIFLSKLIALFVYPFGLLLCLVLAASVLLLFGRRRAAGLMLATAVLLMFVGGNGYVAHHLVRSLENDFPALAIDDAPESDVIVVLGGGIGLPHPPRRYPDLGPGADRLLEGFRLHRAGKADRILLTGGNVFPQPGLQGEAFYARELLALWGVAPDAMVTETKSRNTLQNAEYSAAILERNGWEKVLLVTSATHMSRAVLAFRRAGVEVVPVPTDFTAVDASAPEVFSWIPTIGAFWATTRAVHEYVGRAYYWLRMQGSPTPTGTDPG